MKQETLKVALCGYLPHEVYVQYEGILNGKEISEYYRVFKKKNPCYMEIDSEPCNIPAEIIGLKIAPLKRITQYKKFWLAEAGIKQYKKFYNGRNFKPILFNLSCLTRPIVVKGYNGGEPFVPIEELLKKCVYTGYTAEFINRVSIGQKMLSTFATGEILDYLNRWKIDYRNLIGQGLAIDVETLKENCYA